MASREFFPQRPKSHPMIYAYSDSNPQYLGLLKVGSAEKEVEKLAGQQTSTQRPDGVLVYKLLLAETTKRYKGTCLSGPVVRHNRHQKRVYG